MISARIVPEMGKVLGLERAAKSSDPLPDAERTEVRAPAGRFGADATAPAKLKYVP